MKKALKITSIALAVGLTLSSASLLVACGGNGKSGGFQYESEQLSKMENPAHDYNNNLFYVNSLEFELADPSVIYVYEGKGQGWFYAYGTSDEINCHGVQAWRSKDLSNWECTGVALTPDFENTWAVDNYWAPEVIYDPETKLYYMFYNAMDQYNNGRLCLSVAYSETPDGPFLSPEGKNADGKLLSVSEPVFDLTSNNPELVKRGQQLGINGFVKTHALDASPYIDPVSGEKYLYFSYYNDYGSEGSFLYGMKMKDWYTPDYSTTVMLTAPGHSTVADYLEGRSKTWQDDNVNEGPFMMYHEGKYYLTFSIFGYQNPKYKVIQAIADSPLGAYEKLDAARGGEVIATGILWDHLASAGHHAFITVGDELFIAYHTFKNRENVADGRSLAVDRVVWTKNSQGTPVMHANGPTWSLQPLPEAISGYKNIALDATIDANNSLSDVSYLNDGIQKYKDYDLAKEYEADAGTSVITLEWEDWKTARAIMIYNSYDYFCAFESIKQIDIEYKKLNGSSDTITVKDIPFDNEWYVDEDWEEMLPGGSSVIEFNELAVKSIKITVESKKDGDMLALNEIVVLGKDTPCEGVDKFSEYSYINRVVGSAHIITESENFGTPYSFYDEISDKEYTLSSMYGYDVSHDDGTANAYVEQNGVRDQYLYFKDIYATTFYIEAEFTVTCNKSYANDTYPKFGIAITSLDNMLSGVPISATLFYYIDAQNNYTLGQVGVAPNREDAWDWSNENTQAVPGIKYTNGNTTKLAVLRQGAQFYFFCNDKLIIEDSNFSSFGEDRRGAVGFLCFNTAMRISNYSATADSAKVEAKLAELRQN